MIGIVVVTHGQLSEQLVATASMIVGEANRPQDIPVNLCKTKRLTNMRSATADVMVTLQAPRLMSLEDCLEYISDDELLELIHYVDNINLKYGATEVITDPCTQKVKEIERKAMSVGLKLLHSKVRHLGTEENIKILTKIYFDLKDRIDIDFGTAVKDIIVENNKVRVDKNFDRIANLVKEVGERTEKCPICRISANEMVVS